MLKTTKVESIAEDLKSIDKNSTVNKVDGSSKFSRVKPWVDLWVKSFKFKNKISCSLAKS